MLSRTDRYRERYSAERINTDGDRETQRDRKREGDREVTESDSERHRETKTLIATEEDSRNTCHSYFTAHHHHHHWSSITRSMHHVLLSPTASSNRPTLAQPPQRHVHLADSSALLQQTTEAEPIPPSPDAAVFLLSTHLQIRQRCSTL